MAYVKSYTFDNLSRIGNDSCGLSQRNVQNLNSANYALSNFFASDCEMQRPIEFATSQPNVFYNGGNQVGAGGCNIDINSELLIGSLSTHSKSKLSLLERPFKTVPYLGKGRIDATVESKLLQGENFTNRKTVNHVTEESFLSYSNYPLLPSVASTVTNPANLVEGEADKGWIRGGVPSRELVRDQEYLYNKHQ